MGKKFNRDQMIEYVASKLVKNMNELSKNLTPEEQLDAEYFYFVTMGEMMKEHHGREAVVDYCEAIIKGGNNDDDGNVVRFQKRGPTRGA